MAAVFGHCNLVGGTDGANTSCERTPLGQLGGTVGANTTCERTTPLGQNKRSLVDAESVCLSHARLQQKKTQHAHIAPNSRMSAFRTPGSAPSRSPNGAWSRTALALALARGLAPTR